MSDSKDQPPAGPGGATLLPPSDRLLPPSGAGGTPLDLSGGPELALGAQIGKVAGEARDLAAKAAQLAADKAPELKKRAEAAGAQAAQTANRMFKGAGETARETREMLADPGQRRSFLAAHGKGVIGALAALVILGGGGWTFACHQAGKAAHQAIDGFLARNDLTTHVRYRDLSASPFGSVSLTDVTIGDGGTQMTIGSLRVGGLEMKGGMVEGLDLSARSVRLPLAAWGRQGQLGRDYAPLAGLGYATLSGDLGVSFHLDEAAQTLLLETRGDFADFASWKARMRLGGIGPDVVRAVQGMPDAAQNGAWGLLGGWMEILPSLGQTTVVDYAATLDNSGYFRRAALVPDTALPAAPGQPQIPDALSEAQLQRAGLAPAEAKADREAISGWLAKGGRIAIESNLAQPVPLVTGRNLMGMSFLFDSLPRFLGLTKARITL